MKSTSRWPRIAGATVVVTAMATALAADGGSQRRDDDAHRDDRDGTYAIGAWGDLPYSDLQAQVGVPNLIADMNRQDLEFTLHDGDLKAGNSTPGSVTPTNCSNELYAQALHYFTLLRAPVVFTPGDNDWTDCDRPSNGPFSSLERSAGTCRIRRAPRCAIRGRWRRPTASPMAFRSFWWRFVKR